MARDYLAVLKVDEGDKVDYGVLGMQWGKRRSDAQIAAATRARASSGDKITPTKKAQAALSTDSTSAPAKPQADETSAERYNRLKTQAKNSGANSLDEADLKFVNARTDAIAKVNKLNANDPGWVSTMTKKVLQTAAQTALQNVTDGVAKKYISAPLLDKLNDKSAAIEAESKTPVDYVGKHRAKKK